MDYTFPNRGYQLNVEPDEVRPEDLQVGLPPVSSDTPKMDFQHPPALPAPPVPVEVPSSAIPPPGPGVAAPPIAADPVAPYGDQGPAPPAVAPAQTGAGPGPGAASRLQKDLARVQSDQERDAAAKGNLGVQRAGIEGQIAQAQVEAVKATAARQAALEQATDAEIAKRQGVVDAEDKKFKGMGIRDFWADKTTGARVLAAIAMGMGAAGASLRGGGPNYAMEIIDKAIDRDYQRQRDNILKQKEVVAAARGGVDAARQAKADKLISLENWRKNAYEMAGAQAKVTLSKMGVPEAEAEKNSLLTDVRAKALESKLALEKGIAQLANTRADTTLKYAEATRAREAAKVVGGANKPTESQAKLALLSQQLQGELETIQANPQVASAVLDKMQARGLRAEAADKTASGGIVGSTLVGVGRAVGALPASKYEGMSPQEQQVANAWDNAIEKYARVLTGSGMPSDEARRLALQDAPHAGDSQAVITQKLSRLQAFAHQSMSLAGPAANLVAPAARATAGPQPAQSNRQQVLEASEWLRDHPNDPRGAAVRKKIAELTAGRL